MAVAGEGVPTLALVHGVYNKLDSWWLRCGGAVRVLAAVAGALELLLRHKCVEGADAEAVRAEAELCLAAVSGLVARCPGVRAQEQGRALLVQGLLESDPTRASQAADFFRKGDHQSARETAWAQLVTEVLKANGSRGSRGWWGWWGSAAPFDGSQVWGRGGEHQQHARLALSRQVQARLVAVAKAEALPTQLTTGVVLTSLQSAKVLQHVTRLRESLASVTIAERDLL